MAMVPKATKGTGGNRYQSAPVRENFHEEKFSTEDSIDPFPDEEPNVEQCEEPETDLPDIEEVEEPKTKTEVIKEAGFTPKQVERFQTLMKRCCVFR